VSTSTTLCLSAATLGVGPSRVPQLPQHRVYARPVSFTYVLRPVPAGTKDLGEIARRGVPILSNE
jgi:hypothetical protein